ncbi:hypothetical protein [Paenibacillus antri]|uniref:hypothetical protein n=1 Tax=Paenibacillus antri TaxID=2582848 RepID=UPI001EE42E6F|nr:hypothetical protein [Paenibacillus antri]
MSFLKGLGNFAGEVVGGVLGGTVRVVGEIAGSNFIKEIGDGVEHATKFAGKTAGELASGTWDVAAGIVTQNERIMEDGFSDIGGAVSSTAKGVGHMVVNVVENGASVVKGISDNNTDLLKTGAKGLIYTAAVGAIAVGIIDVADGADAAHAEGTALTEAPVETEPGVHHVEPHYVEGYYREDGTYVEGYYRDGVDGDGYVRTNPDGDPNNNLKP